MTENRHVKWVLHDGSSEKNRRVMCLKNFFSYTIDYILHDGLESEPSCNVANLSLSATVFVVLTTILTVVVSSTTLDYTTVVKPSCKLYTKPPLQLPLAKKCLPVGHRSTHVIIGSGAAKLFINQEFAVGDLRENKGRSTASDWFCRAPRRPNRISLLPWEDSLPPPPPPFASGGHRAKDSDKAEQLLSWWAWDRWRWRRRHRNFLYHFLVIVSSRDFSTALCAQQSVLYRNGKSGGSTVVVGLFVQPCLR
ncbi:hypothetical protein TIFTF001_035480 [Ficus carica]|uniref:Uncharacterized protein n=1 Tax=Ficus carica TaxID=3494 RepID=A0AA88E1M8_FICCA|nr:hypothetical protein TIFTF001_035480 [Ficus carica]